ncbi:GNAT family N-acetyltransferase [Streptomyces sp. ISL-11]|uniref:GNAT family N-acetyltransferase n=1 Tax=Streptomyces sp. ISL-11 TaxID=2819174 RepID=UPI001BEAAA1C|nr:GNAT family N-acetyltransferase [Streptomyces sp. ISL-11]MBT2385108.1 GNAT family N-acetyltransferase [Streptomyces sp. ISL-11]
MAHHDDAEVTYRLARPEELPGIEALDNSFTTDSVIEVRATDEGFHLHARPVDPPLRKVYPAEEDEEDPDARAIVAHSGDRLCAALTFAYAAWNRRLLIADLRVAPAHRGRGVGSALMRRALEQGRELGARAAWLEVTSVNAPAVRAYRRMGFAVCGLDTSLYTGTASEGETALFMSRPL